MAENHNKNRIRITARRADGGEPARREPKSRDEVRRERYLERRRKRKRNLIIGYSAAAIAVVIIAVVLSLTVFFKISSFETGGDEVYSLDEIVAASELRSGENMFAFDREEVAQRVQSKLPYIGLLSIKRSPTGKITFIVTVTRPAMAIDNGDSYTLLDANCKVLEDQTQSINEDVAVIRTSTPVDLTVGNIAVFENGQDAQTLVSLESIIHSGELEKITQIDITDYANIKLKYDLRITLKIGMLGEFADKVDFIKATLRKLDGEEPSFKGTIDFTIENKAFVNDVDEENTTLPAPTQAEEQPQTSDENGDNTAASDGG